MDHTILVVVGDHGEGFGQHTGQGGWVHGGALFQEQIKIPTLIYQPTLFPPQQVTELTSSVDLVPTLLDAMKIAYDTNRFQGESLLRDTRKRKYVFVYGENNEIAALDQQHMKTQISFEEGTCVRYNLLLDPKEQVSHLCEPAVVSAIVKYRNYQPIIFEKYNKITQKIDR